MSQRKCIFTKNNSNSKDTILPKEECGEQLHNWAIHYPTVKKRKKQKFPTDLEMDIHETFYMLELSRLRVQYYEEKLKKLQKIQGEAGRDRLTKNDIKKMEIEKAYKTKNVEEMDLSVVLKERDLDDK